MNNMNNSITNASKVSNYHLIFLTVGEYLSDDNLLYSQVVSIAEKFATNKDLFKDITYVCLPPLRSLIADTILPKRRKSRRFIKGLHFKCIVFPTLFSIVSVTRFLSKSLMARIEANIICKAATIADNTIIHCRSYYSTYAALKIRKQNPHKNIRIVFDMRSLFAQEFPFMMGEFGKMLYGFAKEWEWQLLHESDLALLMEKEGREVLELEIPEVKVHEMPIIGLDINSLDNFDYIEFSSRWSNRVISYVGSYGAWHSLEYIFLTLSYFGGVIGNCKAMIVSGQKLQRDIDRNIGIVHIRHSEIADYYKSLLAVIIPGKKCINYFDSCKLSTNFFSTKAVEALSCGVPLMVNSDIQGLSNFVLENKCGIVFKIRMDKIELLNCSVEDLNCYEFWAEITRNALEVGKQFRLESVANKYLQYYQTIV